MQLTMNLTGRASERQPGATDWSGSEAVYVAAYRDLLRVAYVLTGSGPAAEDVVQDVFASAGPRISKLDDPIPYLRVAVVNRCRSLHRRVRSAPLPDRAENAMLDVGLIHLRDALAELPHRQRAAVVLRYLCDLPDAEIAAIVKCRRATVRSLVKRGLTQLRESISEVPS